MSNVDFEANQRAAARWRILVTIGIGGPWAVNESVIQLALEDSKHRLSVAALRKELSYLKQCGLVDLVDSRDDPVWAATLTAKGTDVVEYTIACPPGVGRPPKWY